MQQCTGASGQRYSDRETVCRRRQQVRTGGRATALLVAVAATALGCSLATQYERIQGVTVSASHDILFQHGSAIWAMNQDGSAPRLLSDNGMNPVCTPDGERILFFKRYRIARQVRDIYAMQRDGSHVAPLTHGAKVDGPLTVSPDGRYAAFVQEGRIYRVDLETGETTPLTEPFPYLKPPVWSPDGASIAFAVRRKATDMQEEAFVLDLASGTTHGCGGVSSAGSFFSWAPDGKRLAIASWPEIRIVEIGSFGWTWVPLPEHVRAESVAWAPDGLTLAFGSESGCAGLYCGEIYTIHPDGSHLRKVSNTRWFHCRCYGNPQWSPDGSAILSVAYRSYGDMDFNPFHKRIPSNIYSLYADGSHERNLSNDETTDYDEPVWCPAPRHQRPYTDQR